MRIKHNENGGVEEILERREAELALVLRSRVGIAIEKSAGQMDEVQYASERDLAIRNVDRETVLLREVRAALRRIHEGSSGTCAWSAKRRSAPNASRLCHGRGFVSGARRRRIGTVREGSDLLSDSRSKAA
jgi:RNA polymerase-binding transcription factor DksA